MKIFQTAGSIQKPRILLIEDDPDDALLFRHALPEGCDLVVAEDGEEGLRAAVESKPHIIFLDLRLPKMCGEDVCKSVRGHEDPAVAAIPIVMFTSKSGEADRVIGRVIGADAYLTKPCRPDDILKELKQRLPFETAPYPVKSNSILVIEDDEDDALLVKTMLAHDRKQSYTVERAKTLKQGLDILKERVPDLIVSDLGLSDSQGIQTFRDLKKAAPDVPILLLTGHQDELMAEEALHEGAQDFVHKNDMNLQILSRAIRYAIERHTLLKKARSANLKDDLTGCHNRSAFLALVEHQLKIYKRLQKDFVMFYVKIMGYADIAGRRGAEAADQAALASARVLRHTFRDSDIIARVAPDEFAVAAVHCDHDSADHLKRRLLKDAEWYNEAKHLPFEIDLSVISFTNRSGEPVDLTYLLERGSALTAARDSGDKS